LIQLLGQPQATIKVCNALIYYFNNGNQYKAILDHLKKTYTKRCGAQAFMETLWLCHRFKQQLNAAVRSQTTSPEKWPHAGSLPAMNSARLKSFNMLDLLAMPWDKREQHMLAAMSEAAFEFTNSAIMIQAIIPILRILKALIRALNTMFAGEERFAEAARYLGVCEGSLFNAIDTARVDHIGPMGRVHWVITSLVGNLPTKFGNGTPEALQQVRACFHTEQAIPAFATLYIDALNRADHRTQADRSAEDTAGVAADEPAPFTALDTADYFKRILDDLGVAGSTTRNQFGAYTLIAQATDMMRSLTCLLHPHRSSDFKPTDNVRTTLTSIIHIWANPSLAASPVRATHTTTGGGTGQPAKPPSTSHDVPAADATDPILKFSSMP
jgi:hypothetical protein